VAAGEEELRTRWSGIEKLSGRRSIGTRGSLAQAAARVRSPPSVPDGARDSVALETHAKPSSDRTRRLAAMRSAISSGWTRLHSGGGFLGGLLLGALPGDHLIPHQMVQWTRGITLRTSVERVWPWLAQMGYGRGGAASWTRVSTHLLKPACNPSPKRAPGRIGLRLQMYAVVAGVISGVTTSRGPVRTVSIT
jgi:hypothetical protein